MFKKLFFPLTLGIVGCSILVVLGTWQINRLEWKTNVLTEIERKLSADPIELPDTVEKSEDQYRSIRMEGKFLEKELHVLTSIKFKGPGYRIIAPFLGNDGRVVMVDRGFVKESEKSKSRSLESTSIIANLLWPDEIDSFTPQPNLGLNIWFARELDKMAQELNSEPILLVLRETEVLKGPEPQPIGINIPNNHLGYAVTWFALAFVWFCMTVYLVWRVKQKLNLEGRFS